MNPIWVNAIENKIDDFVVIIYLSTLDTMQSKDMDL